MKPPPFFSLAVALGMAVWGAGCRATGSGNAGATDPAGAAHSQELVWMTRAPISDYHSLGRLTLESTHSRRKLRRAIEDSARERGAQAIWVLRWDHVTTPRDAGWEEAPSPGVNGHMHAAFNLTALEASQVRSRSKSDRWVVEVEFLRRADLPRSALPGLDTLASTGARIPMEQAEPGGSSR